MGKEVARFEAVCWLVLEKKVGGQISRKVMVVGW